MARSKEFDDQVVLDRAMKLFWQQGYEKTSMNDLTEHMGIHRRSLYDTFTDKHTLFMLTLEKFGVQNSHRAQTAIAQASTAREALESMFGYVIEGGEDVPAGCLLVNSAVELAVRDKEVDHVAVNAFEKTEDLIAGVIRHGQQTGEYSSTLDVEQMAAYLHNALVGLRVLVRTSTDKQKLREIMDMNLRLLEG
ncbi:TetR/AcrR family transcriptional regulator [Paenibacillus sp. WLX1005]|uniref:TetR/AcrR family transcriptional regulator n=1 Tax=Paenibacillus sp. WLX1005 TaxID=3243766 RepID=UPI0039843330